MTRVLVALALLVLLVGVRGDARAEGVDPPRFWLGANYEGPADRAWKMWDDGMFDPALIAADFDRARAANLSVLRLFVQRSLADDVRAARWAKLDRVLDLADQRGLKLILTFADYNEIDLARLARVDAAIAARYRGRPTILAYDLKNEPRLSDLALAIYPPDFVSTLQQASVVSLIGEIVPWEAIAEHRESDHGRRDIPSRLGDDQAYAYANVLAAYRQFIRDAQDWAQANDSTVIRYVFSPDSTHWNPLKQVLNEAFAVWLQARVEPILVEDPDRPLTVGQVDPLLASLPANNWLDYRTIHRYPAATPAGIQSSMALFDDLRVLAPGKPLVLGEFGFSNANVDEATAAALEVEVVLAVRDRGGAGALKWMLNDFPSGANPRENAFGMYRGDGSPKPVVAEFQRLGLLAPSRQAATLTGSRATIGLAEREPDPCDGRGAPTVLAPEPTRAFVVPTWVVVAETDGFGVYIRRTPRLADRLAAWPDGTRLEVIGPDVDHDGVRWKQVRDPCGQTGWVPARYVVTATQ